jgi:hypothetical protein
MSTISLPARIHSSMVGRNLANPAQLAEQARRLAEARKQDGQAFLATLVRQHVQLLDDRKGIAVNVLA